LYLDYNTGCAICQAFFLFGAGFFLENPALKGSDYPRHLTADIIANAVVLEAIMEPLAINAVNLVIDCLFDGIRKVIAGQIVDKFLDSLTILGGKPLLIIPAVILKILLCEVVNIDYLKETSIHKGVKANNLGVISTSVFILSASEDGLIELLDKLDGVSVFLGVGGARQIHHNFFSPFLFVTSL
jgi:hypothetical protein